MCVFLGSYELQCAFLFYTLRLSTMPKFAPLMKGKPRTPALEGPLLAASPMTYAILVNFVFSHRIASHLPRDFCCCCVFGIAPNVRRSWTRHKAHASAEVGPCRVESVATSAADEGGQRAMVADGLRHEHREQAVRTVPQHPRHQSGQSS